MSESTHCDFGIFYFANYIPNTITRIQSSPYPPRGHTNSYAPLGPMIMNLQHNAQHVPGGFTHPLEQCCQMLSIAF